jgi:PIN domain nuclease of toxin-antitoxin system
VDLELVVERTDLQQPLAPTVILLDTNALVWMQNNHPRAAPLARRGARLYISPASLLEIQFLIESGRLRMKRHASLSDLADDERWLQDDPPAAAWFAEARGVGWTHDPFDRLLVAHARLRQWRLATGDVALLEHLEPDEYIEL